MENKKAQAVSQCACREEEAADVEYTEGWLYTAREDQAQVNSQSYVSTAEACWAQEYPVLS